MAIGNDDVSLRFGATDTGISAGIGKLRGELASLDAQASKVGKSIGGSFSAISAGTVAVTAAVTAIVSLAAASIQFADATKKMQDQTALSVETIQRLQFYSSQTSVDMGSLTGGVLKLQKVLGGFDEDAKKAAESLHKIGLEQSTFLDLSPEEQFTQVAIALSHISDQNEKVLRTTELFGKAGAELLPIINAIGNESEKMNAQFDAIGGPVGQAAIDKVDAMGDTASATWISVKNLSTELLALGGPVTEQATSRMQTFIASLRFLVTAGGDKPSEELARIGIRIDEINEALKNGSNESALFGIFQSADSFRENVAKLNAELYRLQQREAALLDMHPVKLDNPIAVNVQQPGDVAFEETDDHRRERESLERVQIEQRLKHKADMYAIEQDMALRNSGALIKIDEDRMITTANKQFEIEQRRLKFMTEGEEFLAKVRKLYGLEQIKFEEIKNQSIIEIAGTLFNTLAAQNSKVAKIQQKIAIAEVIYATSVGIAKAFSTYGPTPAGFLAAGKVALVGAIQYARIRSTNYGSAGSPPSVSGGSAVSDSGGQTTQPGTPAPTQDSRGQTTVYISGFINKDVSDYLIQSLKEGFTRDVIVIPSNSLQASVIRGNA